MDSSPDKEWKLPQTILFIILLTIFLNAHCKGKTYSPHQAHSLSDNHDHPNMIISENLQNVIHASDNYNTENSNGLRSETFIILLANENTFNDLNLTPKSQSNNEKTLKNPRFWQLVNNKYTQYMFGKLDPLGFKYQNMLVYVRNNIHELPKKLNCQDYTIKIIEGNDTKTITDIQTRDLFKKEPKNEKIKLGAFQEEKLAGYVWLSFTDAYVPEIDTRVHFKGTYIWNLNTFESFRRRGIAKCLINKAIEFCYEHYKKKKAFAITSIYNIPSRRVFEANGFKPIYQITVLKLFGRNISKNIVNI